jgi:lipopolysaccharide biosynthesis glycosyltransferase
MVTPNFMPGAIVMLSSFHQHNPWYKGLTIILDHGLSSENRETLKKHTIRCVFRKPQVENYPVFPRLTPKRLHSAYYKLDIFSWSEYDRIVFLDSDVLVLKDIRPLFTMKSNVFRAYQFRGQKFNTGVMSIPHKYLNEAVYKKLLGGIRKHGKEVADQDVLIKVFSHQISGINVRFNATKRAVHRRKIKGYRILHFVGRKPWQKPRNIKDDRGYETLERKWNTYHVRAGGKPIPWLAKK